MYLKRKFHWFGMFGGSQEENSFSSAKSLLEGCSFFRGGGKLLGKTTIIYLNLYFYFGLLETLEEYQSDVRIDILQES
jgi:hypothetical protein